MTNSPVSMGIYVHFPFCVQKCNYCDFYSLPHTAPDLRMQYVDCLERELRERSPQYALPFTSIYLGGGTPSLLPPGEIERVLGAIYRYCRPAGEPEVTMEVNPATVNRRDLADLHRVGINRLSIGVQSLVDHELRILGRLHDSQQARQCIEWSQQVGFSDVNVDLIYGIPEQRLSDWLATLHQVAGSGARHISTYLLQLEPDVPLALEIAAGDRSLLTDDQEADFYHQARALLLNCGYQHYELSSYAHPGRQCRHNLAYWRVGPYLGLGAGAVSFDGRRRSLNSPLFQDYITALMTGAAPPHQQLEILDARRERIEAMVMGLRLIRGIDLDEYRSRFGADALGLFQVAIGRLAAQGLLEVDDRHIALSPRAYFISNMVLREFVD